MCQCMCVCMRTYVKADNLFLLLLLNLQPYVTLVHYTFSLSRSSTQKHRARERDTLREGEREPVSE